MDVAVIIGMNITLTENRTLEQVKIRTLYQPLYSVHEKRYIGYEALSRGTLNDEELNASALFALPENENEKLELNIRCIEAALQNLNTMTATADYTVFLNIDSSIIDNRNFNIQDLRISSSICGVTSKKLVIELIESRVKNFDILMEFVSFCRAQGFLIALDDVGAGYSNLERIVKIKPDIIKIDRSLVNGLSEEFHKKEACRALIELSHNIGALSLVEGVETLNDSLECLEMGADIMQGYYFSKPVENISSADFSMNKIALLTETWRFSTTERNNSLKLSLYLVKKQAASIYKSLHLLKSDNWNNILIGRIKIFPDIECAYILNSEGRQVSLTAIRPGIEYKKHNLFMPAKPGADHSQKYYFNRRSESQKWFISDPYISRATGNICRTVSVLFTDDRADIYYLCLDINQ